LLNNTSVLGYDIVLEFLHRAMPKLLTEDGCCHIWSIFSVPASDTPHSFLSRVLGAVPGFSFEVTLWPHSPFSLSPEEIERGQVRLGSLLLTEPEDRNRLLDFIRRQALSQLVTTTLVARRSDSPAITFGQTSWA
jgi:hypothetical protein